MYLNFSTRTLTLDFRGSRTVHIFSFPLGSDFFPLYLWSLTVHIKHDTRILSMHATYDNRSLDHEHRSASQNRTFNAPSSSALSFGHLSQRSAQVHLTEGNPKKWLKKLLASCATHFRAHAAGELGLSQWEE